MSENLCQDGLKKHILSDKAEQIINNVQKILCVGYPSDLSSQVTETTPPTPHTALKNEKNSGSDKVVKGDKDISTLGQISNSPKVGNMGDTLDKVDKKPQQFTPSLPQPVTGWRPNPNPITESCTGCMQILPLTWLHFMENGENRPYCEACYKKLSKGDVNG